MFWFEKNFIPVPQKYEPNAGNGFEFATYLAQKTQFVSLLFNISGWILIMSGILLGVAGSVLGTDFTQAVEDDAWLRLMSQRGLICNTFAIIFAGIGKQFLSRAKASAELASIATKEIASSTRILVAEEGGADKCDPDREAYDACVLAKAIWLRGRVDDTELNEILNRLGQEKGA